MGAYQVGKGNVSQTSACPAPQIRRNLLEERGESHQPAFECQHQSAEHVALANHCTSLSLSTPNHIMEI